MLHDGHRALINKVLKEYDRVVILVRVTDLDEDNPYSQGLRAAMIRGQYLDEIKSRKLIVQAIVDPGCDLTFVHGRDVGWNVESVEICEELEKISATNLRKGIDTDV